MTEHVESRWTMTVRAAEAVREQIRELNRQVNKLDATRKDKSAQLDRKTKAALARKVKAQMKRRDALHESLKDAPPSPLTPSQAMSRALKQLVKYKMSADKSKADFVSRTQSGGIGHAVEWARGDINSEYQWREMSRVLPMPGEPVSTWLDAMEASEVTIPMLIETIKRIRDSLIDDQMRWSGGRSTSILSNAVEEAKAEARSSLIRHLPFDLTLLKHLEQAVKAHEQNLKEQDNG